MLTSTPFSLCIRRGGPLTRLWRGRCTPGESRSTQIVTGGVKPAVVLISNAKPPITNPFGAEPAEFGSIGVMVVNPPAPVVAGNVIETAPVEIVVCVGLSGVATVLESPQSTRVQSKLFTITSMFCPSLDWIVTNCLFAPGGRRLLATGATESRINSKRAPSGDHDSV